MIIMKKWVIDSNDIIFTAEDPEGRSIHLTKERWKHVQEGHPEVTLTIPKTKSIIQKPDIITETNRPNSIAFTQVTSINLYYNIYVAMNDTFEEGKIKTVFFQKNLPRGGVIWAKK